MGIPTDSTFIADDFSVVGATEQDITAFHLHLPAVFLDEFTIGVGSKTGQGMYQVGHDYVNCDDCTCKNYEFHRTCRSHWLRAKYVLRRRKERREREARQTTLDGVQLKHQRGFSLTK